MDHSNAPPLKKRTNVCPFFRKLTNISFSNQKTNYGRPINKKNGFPNQKKNTLNEFTGVPKSDSNCIEQNESTTSLNTAIEEFFPSLESLKLPSITEEKVEKLSIGTLTPDIISVDGATEDVFHTPSMNSIDESTPSIASIQSMQYQDNKSDSFFSTLDKEDSKQAFVVSSKRKRKSKRCCICSVGGIVLFLLVIIAGIATYVYIYGIPGHDKKDGTDKSPIRENPETAIAEELNRENSKSSLNVVISNDTLRTGSSLNTDPTQPELQ